MKLSVFSSQGPGGTTALVLDPEKKVECQIKMPCSKTVYIIYVARVLTLKSSDSSGTLNSAEGRYPELASSGCIVFT